MRSSVSEDGFHWRSVVNVNKSFDSAKFRVGEFFKFSGNLLNVESVSDPDLGVDVSILDDLNDIVKIGGEGIA